MKTRRIIAAVMSLCMLGGTFGYGMPALKDCAIVADASGSCTISEILSFISLIQAVFRLAMTIFLTANKLFMQQVRAYSYIEFYVP